MRLVMLFALVIGIIAGPTEFVAIWHELRRVRGLVDAEREGKPLTEAEE